MRTVRYLTIAATTLVAALALVSPASATCYSDACDPDPITEPEPDFGDVGVYLPPVGAVDADWVTFQGGVPTGVALTGWSTSTHVSVYLNGFWLMHLPARETSTYMPRSGYRFTVFLPVYPLDMEVCVDAIDYPGGPSRLRLGCRSSFTIWY